MTSMTHKVRDLLPGESMVSSSVDIPVATVNDMLLQVARVAERLGKERDIILVDIKVQATIMEIEK